MKEIRSQDWSKFCDRLNEFERGATVDIRWIDRASNTEKEIASAAEFQEIRFGKLDGCNDHIMVRAGSSEAKTHHEIVEPIHILLREQAGGGFNAIAVEAEEGTTLMRFNPIIRTAWLEGLGV